MALLFFSLVLVLRNGRRESGLSAPEETDSVIKFIGEEIALTIGQQSWMVPYDLRNALKRRPNITAFLVSLLSSAVAWRSFFLASANSPRRVK